jgi:nitroreductase
MSGPANPGVVVDAVGSSALRPQRPSAPRFPDSQQVSVVHAVHARRSHKRLVEPAPHGADLDALLDAAAAAPDHGRLRPWRFYVLEGETQDAFGAVLADAYRVRCLERGVEPDAAKLVKERTKLGRAPMVIVAACVAVEGSVPEIEQIAATAAAVQNLLLVATALGYGSMWRTGEPAYDARVKAALHLAPADTIVGFLYLGTPSSETGSART